MSVIIRLQNLPWSANSMDIRQFFRGLSIPDGGVNIVGGEKGDAFIAFSTDEDARQAMIKNGDKLKDTPISLLLSSRAEMQKVIEQARARTLSMMSGGSVAPVVTAPVVNPTVTAPVVPQIIPAVKNTIQPPVISLSGFLASNAPASRTNNVIEIPGLSNGYTTAAPSLLFNNLPSNMPTIVDTTGSERDKLVGKYGLGEERRSPRDRQRRSRRSRSDSSDSSRSRSRDRHYRYSRSPDRRRSRSPRNRRYRSRSPRGRYYRSSSRERSYDSDKGGRGSPPSRSAATNNTNRNFSTVWDVPPVMPVQQQQSNTTAVFQPYTTKSGAGIRPNDPRAPNESFGRDVFGREIRNDRNEESDACVKVENLEKSTGYGEVRRLFAGLFITNNGIKMINDEYGERTGVAYIRFAKRHDKMTALQRDGNVLRDRKLLIKDITDKEYDDAIDSYRPSHNKNADPRSRFSNKDESSGPDVSGPPFSCLKIVDLPPFAKEQDIIKIFSSFAIMQIVMGRNPKKIYEAYVKFYREDDARQALLATPSFRMAHKFVMISKCTDLEFEAARNEYECATAVDDEPQEEPVESKSDVDTRRQKSPSPIAPNNFNNDPRMASYGANVLQSPRDPRFRRDNDAPSNGNSVQASPITNYNSDSNQGGGTTPSENGTSSGYQSRDPRRRVDPRVQAQLDNSCYLLLANVPLHLAEWDIGEWLSDVGAEPVKVHLLMNSQRQFNGEVLCEFETPEYAKKAAAKDGQQMEKNTIRVDLIPKSRYEEMLDIKPVDNRTQPTLDNMPPNMNNPRQMPPFMGNLPIGNGRLGGMNGLPPMGNMGRGPPPPHMLPPMMNPRMGGPGPDMNDPHFNARVILMENIPYKAGPEEILDYFGPEFDLTPSSIMRRFNERGQPAGEAKVLFHTAADAKQAFNLRKGNKIMGRTIYLKPMI